MTAGAAPDWHARAARLTIDGRSLIDGERREAADGRTLDKHSPIDGRRLGTIARGQAADVDAAVRAARAAFEDGRWAAQAPAARKRTLLRLAERLAAARDELALLDCLDMGKPIQDALTVDVPGAVRAMTWFAEATDKVYGEVAPTPSNALATVTREPLGVVGVIVPWNYPLLLACWKLAPALAAGNSVVLKPSERSPFSALRLAELALEAGLPPGVLNVVPGLGAEAGEALALHLDVDAIAFTGSTRTGRRIVEASARSNLKRVFSDLGGKSAFVVFPDFADLDRAARTAAASLFFNQGESCNAPTRMLVHADIAERFVELVAAESAQWQPGDPLDPASAAGALVDAAHLQQVLGYVDSGRAEGAACIVGGRRARADSGGCYLEPTIFDRVDNGMRIAREEIFGPVMSVIRFETEAQAIALANASSYGLQAAVWSDSLSRAHRVARALRAGTVHVNQYDEDDITVPFGGVRQSGHGRDKSLHAFAEYTALKTTWLRIDPAAPNT